MSYLPQTKWGDCSRCSNKNVACVKKGKDLICTICNEQEKTEKQIQKANRRNAARDTGNKIRRENILGTQYEDNYGAAERQALIHDIDFVFSRIVRIMGSDEKGQCECYTCSLSRHWTFMQCGHYEKRGNTQIRWDFRNVKPQCPTCNETKHGNLEVYTQRLEQEQKGLPELLKDLAREPYKWDRSELKQLLIDLRQRLRITEQKFQTNKTTQP